MKPFESYDKIDWEDFFIGLGAVSASMLLILLIMLILS